MNKIQTKDYLMSLPNAFTSAKKMFKGGLIAVLAMLFSLPLCGSLSAQDIQSSPVSRLGYGTLQNPSPIAWRGMGGVGIGMNSDKIVNLTNPAGFAATDSLSFLLDIGASFNVNLNRDGVNRKHSLHGAIDYVAIKLPLYKNRLALSAGFIPFSNVGYQLSSNVDMGEVGGVNQMLQTFRGEGSLQSLYAGLGFRVTNQFFVGANVKYLFGKLTHTVHNEPNSARLAQTFSQYTLSTSDWGVDLGVQYQFLLGNEQKDKLTLGMTYSPEVKMTPSLHFFENRNYGSANKPELYNNELKPTTASPHKIGAGMAWNMSDRLILAGDFTAELWSGVPNLFVNDGLQLKDRYRGALGVEFLPDRYSRDFGKRVYYRAGLNYSNGYFTNPKIGETHQIGASIGFGLPIHTMVSDRTSVVNLSIEYLHEAFSVQKSLNQDVWRVSLSINFNETWFRELKIY